MSQEEYDYYLNSGNKFCLACASSIALYFNIEFNCWDSVAFWTDGFAEIQKVFDALYDSKYDWAIWMLSGPYSAVTKIFSCNRSQ